MFHGGSCLTLPAGGQNGVSPQRNAYVAFLRSPGGNHMILSMVSPGVAGLF